MVEVRLAPLERHTAVVKAQGHAGVPLCEGPRLRETVCFGIEATHEPELLEQRVTALPRRVFQVLAFAEVAYAAQASVLRMPLELALDIWLGQPRLGHDAMRHAGAVGHLLE